MNSVVLSGQIVSDIQFLEQGGESFARIEIHTLTTFQDAQGEIHHRFDEHRVLVFGSLVRRARLLKDGDWITVRGAMRTCGFLFHGRELLDVEILASEVASRPSRNRPDLSAHPTATAKDRCSWRTPRPRFARSRRRAPGRGIQPVHPVDDALLFDPFEEGLLAMRRDAKS